MTSNIRRPQPGDRVRKLADIHGRTIAWFTVCRVAFRSEGDYRDVLALEYGHEVDGNLCFHSVTAALNDQHRDVHGYVVGYEEAARETETATPTIGAVPRGSQRWLSSLVGAVVDADRLALSLSRD